MMIVFSNVISIFPKKYHVLQTQELDDVGSERTHNLKVVGSNLRIYKLETESKPCPVLFLSSRAS